MLEDEERPTLTLKDGNHVDGISAYLMWQRLEGLDPDVLRAFASLGQGDRQQVPPQLLNALQNGFHTWFGSDGSLSPLATGVVQNAIRDGVEGPVVVTPFLATDERDVETLARIHRQSNELTAEFLNQWSDGLLDKNNDPLTREIGRDVRRCSNDLFKDDGPPGHSRRR